MPLFANKYGPLPHESERDLQQQFEAEVGKQIPLLAPLFGLSVVAAAVWDYLIDPANATLTFALRIALVGLGGLAYWTVRWWRPHIRTALIYLSHTSAAIVAAALLENGLMYQIGGIACSVFPLSIITLRLRHLLALAAVPLALLAILAALSMPPALFANAVAVYLVALVVTCLLMKANRISRETAYLLEQRLADIAHHDALTGLYNRGHLTELAERELELARRHARPLAVAMLDIDHFKAVNDTWGHDIGDDVIRALANACRANMRRIDHIGRVGGEEFVCIMPESTSADALACAERLRQHIAQLQVPTPSGSISFTVSIGVAVLDGQADWHALLKDADTALYRAKETGRNRIVLAAARPVHRVG